MELQVEVEVEVMVGLGLAETIRFAGGWYGRVRTIQYTYNPLEFRNPKNPPSTHPENFQNTTHKPKPGGGNIWMRTTHWRDGDVNLLGSPMNY